jgi:hypothetical protein
VLALAAVPCSPQAHDPSNGLTGRDRDDWYHLSQGAEFFPLRFLRALNDMDTGEPFMKNLERFGFVPDAPGPANPFGVPVGMTVEETRDLRFAGVKMVGLNCAACHTAVLEIRGLPALRVDGGTNLFDADRFGEALIRSVQKTVENPVELAEFVGRLIRQPADGGLGFVGRLIRPPADRGLGVRPVGAVADPLARKMGADIHKVFDAVEGPEKILGDRLHELIRIERQRQPLPLTRGIVTQADDPKLKVARETLAAEVRGAAVALAFPDHGKGPFKQFPFLKADEARKAAALTFGDVITTLRLLRGRLEALKAGGHPVITRGGPGRVDAFGRARNKVFPKNQGPLDAPVRYPFLWTVKDGLKWYHWDGNTTSRQERNAGEALGVGVVLDLDTGESTLRFTNLMRLEELAKKLTAPAWPEDAFGKIDRAKADRGAKHFADFCAKCHAGRRADGTVIVPLASLKTDGQRVRNIRQPLGDVGFFDAISPLLKKVIAKAGGKPDGDANHWRPSKANQPDLPLGYPNRPLPAVWASPPYLHNGSVPNLYQLLLPAEQRDKQFPVGHREYDPQHLGYTLRPARVVFLYDTRLPGNSNSGHSGPEYGTEQLTEGQRWELIEFLKTR